MVLLSTWTRMVPKTKISSKIPISYQYPENAHTSLYILEWFQRRGDPGPSTLTLNPKPQTLDTIICTCAKHKCPPFTLYLATGMIVGFFIEDLSPSHFSHDLPVSEKQIIWRQNKVVYKRRSCMFLKGEYLLIEPNKKGDIVAY